MTTGYVSLIDWLRGQDPDRARPEAKMRAVLEHLRILFNTRHGSVPHLEDYGLPDISVVFQKMPESTEMLRRAIQTTIEKYEPRLEQVRVRLAESDKDAADPTFQVTYHVTGVLDLGGERTRMEFDTTVSETGQVRLQ